MQLIKIKLAAVFPTIPVPFTAYSVSWRRSLVRAMRRAEYEGYLSQMHCQVGVGLPPRLCPSYRGGTDGFTSPFLLLQKLPFCRGKEIGYMKLPVLPPPGIGFLFVPDNWDCPGFQVFTYSEV